MTLKPNWTRAGKEKMFIPNSFMNTVVKILNKSEAHTMTKKGIFWGSEDGSILENLLIKFATLIYQRQNSSIPLHGCREDIWWN